MTKSSATMMTWQVAARCYTYVVPAGLAGSICDFEFGLGIVAWHV